MSQGEFISDVLVLHPASSTWWEFEPGGENVLLKTIGEGAKALVKMLREIECPFDLGDEVIISKYGRIESNRFVMEKMSYSTVIIPPMTVIRKPTYNLVKEFAENGGNIVLIKNKKGRCGYEYCDK